MSRNICFDQQFPEGRVQNETRLHSPYVRASRGACGLFLVSDFAVLTAVNLSRSKHCTQRPCSELFKQLVRRHSERRRSQGLFQPHACKPRRRHLLTSPKSDPGELQQSYCPGNTAIRSHSLRSRRSHRAVLQACNASLGSVCPQQLLPIQSQGPS